MQENNEKSVQGVQGTEWLTLTLGDEEYGVAILNVQEIRGYETVTKIANAPSFIKGVINLRGEIVPIVDMRIKFGLSSVTYNALTVVIVLNVSNRIIGMVVDGVSDVITLTNDQIRVPPEMGAALDTKYIIGMGTIDDRMIILVDIQKLMSAEDMALFDKVAA